MEEDEDDENVETVNDDLNVSTVCVLSNSAVTQ